LLSVLPVDFSIVVSDYQSNGLSMFAYQRGSSTTLPEHFIVCGSLLTIKWYIIPYDHD